jgi:hypothetical protein
MFEPYEWHEHQRLGKPRWRVRQGMAERRMQLIDELNMISEKLGSDNFRFADVDKWHEVKQAVLACEESEEVTSS